MVRKMEENTYDNLSGDMIRGGLIEKVIVVDGLVWAFDLTTETNTKLDEMLHDVLQYGTPLINEDIKGVIESSYYTEQAVQDSGLPSRFPTLEIDVPESQPATPDEGTAKAEEEPEPDPNKVETWALRRGVLPNDDVLAIRKDKRDNKTIAQEYRISEASVYNIKKKKAYAHVK